MSDLLREIQFRISMIGKLPMCNQKKERAPKIKGFVFFLCYRCTGVVIGGIIATILKICKVFPNSLFLVTLFSIPMAVDYMLQYFNIKESTNIRRFITGLTMGFGLTFF
jgi:uncharacterized membrane protein